jgi:antirestriction protein ArdC
MAKKQTRRDIYQEVTDTVVGYLDRGVAPWRNPIIKPAGDGLPKSLSTGKPYRGINTFLLALKAWTKGYASDYWLTFNQAKSRGGQVRKGEQGTLVVFWKRYATEDKESGEKIEVPVLRHYVVFNGDQVEGIDLPSASPEETEAPFYTIDPAEEVLAAYQDPPRIVVVGSQAVYTPRLDEVRVPLTSSFVSAEAYYATLFHELAHSTGHSKRLNRGIDDAWLAPFGSPNYGREELIAEFGSAFLCAAARISPPTIHQAAAYIDGWRKSIRADKKLVVQAAGQGQRAADYILGREFNDVAAEQDVSPPPQPQAQRELGF